MDEKQDMVIGSMHAFRHNMHYARHPNCKYLPLYMHCWPSAYSTFPKDAMHLSFYSKFFDIKEKSKISNYVTLKYTKLIIK